MKNFLIFLIILAILTGGFLTVRSDLVEVRHRELELAVDRDDVQALALEAVITELEMLTRLREMGVTAVGLREAPVSRYRREGTVAVAQGGELLNAWRTTGTVHPRIAELIERGDVSSDATYLVTDNTELAARLKRKAELKLKKPVRTFFTSAPYVIEVMEDVKRVENLRVGLDPRDVENARLAGLRIVPRPDNQFLKDEAAVEETLDEFLSLPREMLSAIIFEGTEATGFPDNLTAAAEKLNEANVPFGIVEYNPRTLGAFTLAEETGYNAVLAHSNWPNEKVQGIVTSVRERRVRLLYARVNLADPNFYETGTALIAGLAETAAEHGFVPGPVKPFATPPQEPLFLHFMLFGVAAAATLLLRELIGSEPVPLWLIFAFTLAGLFALFPVLSKNLALQAVSIAAAMIFPTLAVVTQQVNRLPSKKLDNRTALFWSLATIGRTFLFAIAGGLVVLGLTATPYFTAGIPLFRGVKLVHTLPLLAIGVAVAMRVSFNKPSWTIKDVAALAGRVLSQPVLVGYLVVFFLLGILGIIYVGRTGHTAGIPVPAFELQLRLLLGEFLLVRPRLKEFIFGYPLSMLGLLLMAKGYRNVISAAMVAFGAIATVSVVNTFMHFTTPGYNTILRSLNGLWLGIVFGLCLTAAVFLATRLVKRVAQP